MRREICKQGVLQQKKTETKAGKSLLSSKKIVAYLPEKLHVLCVHDEILPFLEVYGNDKEVLSHQPQQVLDLLHCSYISKVVEDDRTFIIGFDDASRPPLELTALSADECEEWILILTRELTRLDCLPPQDNLYSPLPLNDTHESSAWNNFDQSETDLDQNLDSIVAGSSVFYESFDNRENNECYYECIAAARNPLSANSSPPDSSHTCPKEMSPNFSKSSSAGGTLPRQNSQPPLPPKIKQQALPPGYATVNKEAPIYDDLFCSPASSRDYCELPRKPDIVGKSLSDEKTELDYDCPLSNGAISAQLYGSPPKRSSLTTVIKEHEYINVNNDQNLTNSSQSALKSPPDNINLANPNKYSEVGPPRPLNKADLARLTKNVSLKRQTSKITTSTPSQDFVPLTPEQSTACNLGTVSPEEDLAEIPMAPRTAPPAPPLPARPVSFEQPKNSAKAKPTKHSVKENDVFKLSAEIEADLPINILVSPEAVIRGLALVEFDGSIWVAGWNVRYNASLSIGFHVGDKLLAVGGKYISPKLEETKRLIDSLAFAGPLELTLKRLPYGRAFILKRDTAGEKLGIIRKKSKNEIIEIESNSLAALAGVPPKTASYSNPGTEVNWFITEINGRPINLFAKNNEAGERLSAVGYDISLVVQPVNFIKTLRKCLKQQKKNYRDYIIGC